MEIVNSVLGHLVTLLVVVIPAYLLHRREMAKKNKEIQIHKADTADYKIKAEVLDKILDFSAFNKIKDAVDEIFKTTRADRFLILIAINGKVDFNVVSVIFEQHKVSDYQVNAIARYKSLKVDDDYRNMLKRSEKYDIVELETATMNESLLKDIYTLEGVKFSNIRHLLRIKADERNDILVYSSLATHNEKGFSQLGKRTANMVYDSVIRSTIKKVLEK